METSDNNNKKEINTLKRKLLENRSIINNLPFPAWIKDKNGKITYVNKAYADYFGMTQAKMTGLTNDDIYKDKTLAKKYTADDLVVIKEKKYITNEVINENKRSFKIYKSPIFDEHNNVIGLTGVSIEITEQRNMISRLSREHDLLQALMDNIPDTIYFKDTASRFTRINKAQTNMLGLKNPEDAIGKTDFDFFNKEHATNAYNDEQELMTSGKALVNKVEQFINASNETKWMTATKMPLKNEKGEITGMVGISRDVSDSIFAEQKLTLAKQKAEESEKLKSAFLANISHQIRTPMNGIVGFLNLLEQNNVSEDDKEECIRYIKKSSKQLLNLINKIIVISEIESGQVDINYTETNVNLILKELYDEFNLWLNEDPDKNIKFNLSLGKDDDAFNIVSDPYRLKEILQNLIENAIKFTDKGYVEFGYNLKNNELTFFIKDSGVGIPADKHNVIFKRFDQSSCPGKIDPEGTGIGLTITKYLVSQMGGKIEVESKPGKGTIFRFNIPYEKPDKA